MMLMLLNKQMNINGLQNVNYDMDDQSRFERSQSFIPRLLKNQIRSDLYDLSTELGVTKSTIPRRLHALGKVNV